MERIIKKIKQEAGLNAKFDGVNILEVYGVPKDKKFNWIYFCKKVSTQSEGKVIASFKGEYVRMMLPYYGSDKEKTLSTLSGLLDRKFYLIKQPPKEHLTIICKITNLCNLDCQYCYDKPFRDAIGHNKKLSLEELDKLFRLASEHAEKVTFLFHGGEPTVVGLNYYKEIFFKIAPKYPYCEWDFSIQTNGTLLDDDWFEFAKEHSVYISSSYSAMSEELRETKDDNEVAGEENIFSVLPKIKRAKDFDLNIGVIDVMTKVNHPEMIERYEFYKRKDVSPSFNSVDVVGEARDHDFAFTSGEDKKKYLKTTTEYFKHWLTDQNAVCERYASQFIQMLFTGQANVCLYCDGCIGNWIGINSNGDIYPCDRPLPDKYRAGNIAEFNSIAEVFDSPNYKNFATEHQDKVNNYCKSCIIYDYCDGGCPMADIDFNGRTDKINPYACSMTILDLTAAFRAVSEADFEGLNPIMQEFLKANDCVLPKEIPEIIKELNPQNDYFDGLNYNEKGKLNSKEFQVFKALNPTKLEEKTVDAFVSMYESTCGDLPDNRKANILAKLKENNKV